MSKPLSKNLWCCHSGYDCCPMLSLLAFYCSMNGRAKLRLWEHGGVGLLVSV